MGRREVFCDRYSITVLPHLPVCFWGGKEGRDAVSCSGLIPPASASPSPSAPFLCRRPATYRAAVLQDAVGEPAVALGSDLHVVGSLDEDGFLQVARLLVHVGDAVLAVVGDVLGALGGQEAQEGHLDAGGVGGQVLIAVAELEGRGEELKPAGIMTTLLSGAFWEDFLTSGSQMAEKKNEWFGLERSLQITEPWNGWLGRVLKAHPWAGCPLHITLPRT